MFSHLEFIWKIDLNGHFVLQIAFTVSHFFFFLVSLKNIHKMMRQTPNTQEE